MYFHSGRHDKGPNFRLDRILSNRGLGSRKAVMSKIKTGKVRVDGIVVKGASQKFPVESNVTVDGIVVPTIPLLMAFYKPLNVLSSMGDPIGRPSLLEAVPKVWAQTGLHPVGRLDADTTGLLLFSSNGKVTNQLLDPKIGVEREYVATVEGDAMQEGLKEKLAAGIKTSLGTFSADLVEQKEGMVRVVVTEGKYRMVRRILANSGLPVVTLHRTRYGAISLDSLNISEGEYSPVTTEASDWALALLKQKRGKSPTETVMACNPSLSKHGNPEVPEVENIKLRSYTLKPTEWDLTEEEKLAELDEANWRVYTGEDYVERDEFLPLPEIQSDL